MLLVSFVVVLEPMEYNEISVFNKTGQEEMFSRGDAEALSVNSYQSFGLSLRPCTSARGSVAFRSLGLLHEFLIPEFEHQQGPEHRCIISGA